VTAVNDEARRLLGLHTAGLGRPLEQLVPPGRLRDVLSGAVVGPDETVLTEDYCLTVNRMPVALQGRELGAVVTLRDRTELVGALRELDSVRGLTDALRAQQHEFANRMHTLAGLIELGDQAEAIAFITQTEAAQIGAAEAIRARVLSAPVAALILAKQTVAAERGVHLELSADSLLDEAPDRVQALITILGNLVDNAIDAAAGNGPPATVELRLRVDEGGITARVTDTGPGVPAELTGAVFQDGFTTKAPRGEVRRGLGLALVQRTVTQVGGRITVRPGPGAAFTVWLPTAMVPVP
jgi:two-component system CitB family sensor kinase